MKLKIIQALPPLKILKKVQFGFCRVSVQDVKEVKKLSTGKATQSTDIPVKILKENADIFGSYICHFSTIV